MAIIIEGGILIGGNITISPDGALPPPSLGMLFEYNAGNSMSYSGSGSDFGNGFSNGPSNYNINYLFDLNSDYVNSNLGNYGFFYTSNVDASTHFVSQGNQSYFKFSGADNTNIDSNGLNGYVLQADSSYTLFAMVQVNDFGNPSNPSTWTGGIVGGDQTVFGFTPIGTSPSYYPALVASNQGLTWDVYDINTQFQPNTWYAVAVTYDNNTQEMKLYVDGVNTATSTGVTTFNSNEPLYWGTWEGSNYLNGNMAIMTAWGRALTGPEIASYTTSVSGPYKDTPTQTYSQLFTIPGQNLFVVPQGVNHISMVAVGAGGSGTQNAHSNPGQLSGVFAPASQFTAQPNQSGSNTNQIYFDSTTYPGLMSVTTDFMVSGIALNNHYPKLNGAALALVTAINSTDPNNVIITLNKNLDYTTSDEFTFTLALVAADGGPEFNDSQYYNGMFGNGSTGPGQRALPLVYNAGGGSGGVVDYLASWGLGGGGAGGYGVNDPIVAFDPNQSYIYHNAGNSNTGEAQMPLLLSNGNLSVEATADNFAYPGIATGTYAIQLGDKVLFSLTADVANGNQAIGIGNYNANIQSGVGYNVYSAGFYDDGLFYTDAHAAYSGYPSFTTSDVVDLAVDNTTGSQRAWIRVNGGNWNGDVAADPSTATNGVPFNIDGLLYLMTTQGSDGQKCKWSINTSNAYSTPSGYTFIAGNSSAGSTGGDGSYYGVYTAKPGQPQGSGAGGAGRYEDSGTGGGGTGLYGNGSAGSLGVWAGADDLNNNYTGAIATGGRGGSRRGNSGTQGGQATAWNGGYGGWPGGGGGSATGYYDSGNGGALAFSNNVGVVPGQYLTVFVGQGGVGEDNGGTGSNGAVRIIWPGDTRLFPNTNAGVDPAGPTSITIGASDFAQGGSSNNMSVVTSGGWVTGMTSTGGNNIIDSYVYLYGIANDTLAQNLTALFRRYKMTTFNSMNYQGAGDNPAQFNSYIFNVTWADSSTGKVRMSWNLENGYVYMSVIDTAYNNWQTSDPTQNNGNPNPVLAGTFNFPATFTPVTPLIQVDGAAWC